MCSRRTTLSKLNHFYTIKKYDTLISYPNVRQPKYLMVACKNTDKQTTLHIVHLCNLEVFTGVYICIHTRIIMMCTWIKVMTFSSLDHSFSGSHTEHRRGCDHLPLPSLLLFVSFTISTVTFSFGCLRSWSSTIIRLGVRFSLLLSSGRHSGREHPLVE